MVVSYCCPALEQYLALPASSQENSTLTWCTAPCDLLEHGTLDNTQKEAMKAIE
jgi:hypothetical protein